MLRVDADIEKLTALAQKKADEEGAAYLVITSSQSPIDKHNQRMMYIVRKDQAQPEDLVGEKIEVLPARGVTVASAAADTVVRKPGTNGHIDTWGKRNELPALRTGHTQKFRMGGMTFYLRTGEYADGTLGEIFIDAGKQEEFVRCALNWLAISVSLGLQHGVPLEEFVDAMVGEWGGPRGPVQLHPEIKMARSAVDLFFRHLGMKYLKLDRDAKNKVE